MTLVCFSYFVIAFHQHSSLHFTSASEQAHFFVVSHSNQVLLCADSCVNSLAQFRYS
ncbi:hypothetical protein CROQUDRAFT_658297 [Cronartium quercuum f. sp. fusiforme G11]|uniref:Uncharacterized protein n=1 Tax=Cronartium quercuum f. sp. fusiforme G11 TaxID=708437 RepID=A0A9P6TCM1_9BASI|nr:hypothetical protein CROQUDRAFT_658297 [Cronartium quercuum f. sp. fusiforme G11]